MNDLRDAMERVGARFDPPVGGLADLTRRRRRARVRRRATAGMLALAVAAGGILLAVRAFPASTAGRPGKIRILYTWPAAASATPPASAAIACPTPAGDSPPPVVLSSTSGPAGSSVEVTGTFGSSELWMQLLWNAGEISGPIRPPAWPPTGPDLSFAPAGPGPVVQLAAVAGPATTGRCSFTTRFTVPDVDPGTYQLRWFFGGLGDQTGPRGRNSFYVYALAANVLMFRVTG